MKKTRMNTGTIIFLLIALALIVYGAYILAKTNHCKTIEGKLVGYVEEENTADENMSTSTFPVYEVYINGERKLYQSKVSVMSFLKHDTKTLYVDDKGVIYEKETAIFCFVAAVAIVVVRVVIMFIK